MIEYEVATQMYNVQDVRTVYELCEFAQLDVFIVQARTQAFGRPQLAF